MTEKIITVAIKIKKLRITNFRKTEYTFNAAEKVRMLHIRNFQKANYVFEEKEVPLPDEERLKLGLALLVDYKTAIQKQCKLLRITNYLSPLNQLFHKNLYRRPKDRFQWIYGVENGKMMLNVPPNQAIQEFVTKNRIGLMTVEGLALFLKNRNILKDHHIDLTGSQYDEFNDVLDCVPYLYLNKYLYNGRSWPSLGYGSIEESSTLHGAASKLRI